jgi:hypothetical protein
VVDGAATVAAASRGRAAPRRATPSEPTNGMLARRPMRRLGPGGASSNVTPGRRSELGDGVTRHRFDVLDRASGTTRMGTRSRALSPS